MRYPVENKDNRETIKKEERERRKERERTGKKTKVCADRKARYEEIARKGRV